MASKPNILVGCPADIPTPAANEIQYFTNMCDNGAPYYKDDSGDVHPVPAFESSGTGADISKNLWDKVGCALKSGLMSPSELNTFVSTGFGTITVPTSNGGNVIVTGTPAVIQQFITDNGITF